MIKNSDDFLKMLLRDKTLKLQALHDQHRVNIAIYDTKRDMLISDVDMIEKQLADKKL